jgi:hypothetical protein
MKPLFFFLALTNLAFAQTARPTPFSPDSALALLRTLSVDIGPRPMGSTAEQNALQWAAGHLEAAGLDDVRIMDVRTTPPGVMRKVRNTRSGVAYGTLRGTTDRIFIIGAHIDSASPEVPGANDDGSGTAVVLELARVMAQREWHHTIVFCLFGGEEGGLVGSRVFAEQYERLDRVDLMLQVDMANGVDDLVPFIDKGTMQTPSWLLSASQEALLDMGYGGLSYPFHFFTWNIASGSGASSDHEPFLVRGIPAIDFTTDPTDPIHTPQDSWEWFRPGGLERSGDLVYRLVERFDGGTPEQRTGSYIALPVASTFLVIPTWSAWVLVVASIVAGIVVTIRQWRSRTELRGTPRPRVPGLKVFGALFIIWLAAWGAENVVSIVSGWRSPWFAQPWIVIGPVAAAALAALVLVGVWSRRWDLSRDPWRYILRSTVWFTVLTVGTALVSPRLAGYVAWGLAFNVLTWMARPAWLRVVLATVGAWPAVRLLTPDLFPFIARMFAQIPAHGFVAEAALTAGLALVCTIVALPYAFGALAVLRDPSVKWPVPLSYRRPWVVGGSILLALLTAGAASLAEPYSAARPRSLTIASTIVEGRDTASSSVASAEVLRDLRLIVDNADTLTPGARGSFALPEMPARADDWLKVDAGAWSPTDTGTGGSGLMTVSLPRAPIRMVVTAVPASARILHAEAGLFAVNRSDRSAEAIFEPPAAPHHMIPLTLHLSAADTVALTVEATYAIPAVDVAVEGAPVNVERRTIVRASRRVVIPPSPSHP